MAANKFATMLHKNTNKITMILIYAVLEWTLISLLLLNSFFSYMIIKFANYFGLKPPCPLCSRIDHLFEHEKTKAFCKDLLCEAHAKEISQLGFCLNHQKLVESQDMCEDCLSSPHDDDNSRFECSCCDVKLEKKSTNESCEVDDLGDIQKGNLVIESTNDDLVKERSDFDEEKTDLDGLVIEKVMKDQGVQVCVIEDSSFEYSSQHLEFFVECSGHKLVPVELIDSTTEEDHCKNHETDENCEKNDELVVEINKIEEEDKFAVLDSMEMEEDENGFSFCVDECHSVKEFDEQFDQFHQESATDNVQIEVESVREENDSDVTPEEVSEIQQIDEIEAEVSIGNEIPDMNLSDEIPCEVSLDSCTHEEHFTSSAHFHDIDQHGPTEDNDKLVELKLLSLEFDDHVMNNESLISSKLDEIEEEKVPETPTSIDSFYQLHKKLLLLEKKDFGTESLDGSVVSELEGGDAVSSIEHLKSALKAERKALHALYTELEEERSASAVAANQTMAMINKLQEEKSAMQMEALQYQRMMEEQSEYDQEALQLLNELMVKREKEKQELEKELEVYRKRLSEYEAKEKAMRMLKRSKDGSVARSGLFSSASCSNGEDSEELSIDLNQEPKEDVNFYCHQECDDHDNKVQVDAFLELEESFVDFEEERMSILEQLKMLEEKLISMDDEDAKEFEDVRPMDDSYRENGDHTVENSRLDGEINEHANGFLSEMNGKLIINPKGKGLLPLFDAMSDENGDVMINGHENGFHSNDVDEENKKLDIEEELDLLHERLQALEADREFLKNCMSSLKKGDKGMDLLHEILQHLRDLKTVDLRVRSSSNGLIL